jgi:hypothetical protein
MIVCEEFEWTAAKSPATDAGACELAKKPLTNCDIPNPNSIAAAGNVLHSACHAGHTTRSSTRTRTNSPPSHVTVESAYMLASPPSKL